MTAGTGAVPVQPKGSALDRALRLFADVRPGEGATTALLAANLLLIRTAYYVLKPVREALILGHGSPELKSYLSAAQSRTSSPRLLPRQNTRTRSPWCCTRPICAPWPR